VKKARNSTTHTPIDSRRIFAGSPVYSRNAAMSRAAASNSAAVSLPFCASGTSKPSMQRPCDSP
jgi:hypothetical protein